MMNVSRWFGLVFILLGVSVYILDNFSITIWMFEFGPVGVEYGLDTAFQKFLSTARGIGVILIGLFFLVVSLFSRPIVQAKRSVAPSDKKEDS